MARKLVVELLGDSGSLERAFSRSSRAASGWNRDLSRAGRGAIVASVGFRGLGRSIAFASGAFIGSASLAAGLKASIQGFSSFNEAMQQAVGLAGVAQSRISGFSKQILALSTVVGKSPQELAKAFYFVASSGIAASKAMDVVTASAKASAAGLGETQVVADAVTSAMNAYGPSVLSAQKATDVLVATVREGKGEADQFAGVIGNVAAIASQLGVSFNEVGAALAAQTRLGTDAETAATQLQRVFASLVKVTPQQAKAFKSVGLNADVLRDQLGKKGLLFVLEEVRKAFSGNLPALAKAFGDVRAVRGVLALVGNQAQATEGIFRRMTDTTGSLKTAFDAVSKDTAQQFRKLRASAEVAGISIGAIFAPLAGEVARALASATDQFTAFLNRFSAAKTITGKLNVVWQGISDAAHGAESALSRAVAAIDWDQVWASARGIADGLQKQLDSMDFNFIGVRVGEGIAESVKQAIPAAKDIATRLTVAVRSIDFVSVGKAMGPGLAAALASAFVTLTDPTFWAKNWDLALAVGLTVFGDGLGRIAGKLAAPLLRFGAGIVERIGFALIDAFPRLSQIIFDGFSRLIPLAVRALSPLVNVVERLFARLGGVTRFVVKVIGIQAVLDAIVRFVHRVEGLFVDLKNFLEKIAIEAALVIVKPLDFEVLGHHLVPGLHRLVVDMEGQLDDLASHSEKAAGRINTALGSIGGAGAGDRGTSPEGARGERKSANTALRGVKGRFAGMNAMFEQTRKLAEGASSGTGENALKKAQARFQKLIDALDFSLEQAQATKRLSDDIAAQRRINQAIENEIKIEGRTTDLMKQLFEGRQSLANLQREQTQQKQFSALGLDATGQPKVPSVAALTKRLSSVKAAVKGTFLDTQKTQSELTRIAKVLSGAFGKVGSDVRSAILGMLNDIANALKQGGQKGPLTKFKVQNFSDIAKQFPSLSADDARRLKQLLARRGPGGTISQGSRVGGAFGLNPVGAGAGSGNFNINGPVTIVVEHGTAEEIQREMQRKKRRTARSRTGSGAGRDLGIGV